jgi:broad specificity phosphatase PhoE
MDQDSGLRIYLARHGETEWNRLRRMQGWSDVPLNERGVAQAELLARRLAGVPLAAVYCSTLTRSRQTAAVFAGRAPVTALVELREQGLGRFEGLVLDGSQPDLETDLRRRFDDPDDTLDGGESYRQHEARVAAAVARIRAAEPRGAVLIVGHGGTNRLILKAIFSLTDQDTARINQANDELYVIELGREKPRLLKWVDPDRLEEL